MQSNCHSKCRYWPHFLLSCQMLSLFYYMQSNCHSNKRRYQPHLLPDCPRQHLKKLFLHSFNNTITVPTPSNLSAAHYKRANSIYSQQSRVSNISRKSSKSVSVRSRSSKKRSSVLRQNVSQSETRHVKKTDPYIKKLYRQLGGKFSQPLSKQTLREKMSGVCLKLLQPLLNGIKNSNFSYTFQQFYKTIKEMFPFWYDSTLLKLLKRQPQVSKRGKENSLPKDTDLKRLQSLKALLSNHLNSVY